MAEPELTVEQTKKFLESVLHLPQDVIKNRGLEFLKAMIVAWAQYLPYQNVTQVLLTKHKGRLATREEMIKELLDGRGGVCLYHAYFAYRVLETIGFRVQMIPSSAVADYDHAIVIAHDVAVPGDEYLVEVGIPFAMQELVPIHILRKSETATIVYKQAGLEFKYVLRDNILSRYHRFGDDPALSSVIPAYNQSDIQGGWKRFYDSELRDFGLDIAFSPENQLSKCVTIKDDRYFLLNQLRVVKIERGKLTLIKGDVLMTQDNENGRQETPFADDEECLDAFRKHFPMLDIHQVKEALEYVKHAKNQ